MLGVEPPNDPDSDCFERGATRTGAGHGWADVWKRAHFGWENKGPGGDLSGAPRQLMTYALALDDRPRRHIRTTAAPEVVANVAELQCAWASPSSRDSA